VWWANPTLARTLSRYSSRSHRGRGPVCARVPPSFDGPPVEGNVCVDVTSSADADATSKTVHVGMKTENINEYSRTSCPDGSPLAKQRCHLRTE
jgi:hypothetical protein